MNVQVRHRLTLAQLTQAVCASWSRWKGPDALPIPRGAPWEWSKEDAAAVTELRAKVRDYLRDHGELSLVAVKVDEVDARYGQAASIAFGAPWVATDERRAGR